MTNYLLLCSDLDRTLLPNGPQAESADVRERFASIVSRPEGRWRMCAAGIGAWWYRP